MNFVVNLTILRQTTSCTQKTSPAWFPNNTMETQDVQIRATEFQGKPLHIIKPMDRADHLFVRAAGW